MNIFFILKLYYVKENSLYIYIHKKIDKINNSTRMERIDIACKVYEFNFLNGVKEQSLKKMAENVKGKEGQEGEEVLFQNSCQKILFQKALQGYENF